MACPQIGNGGAQTDKIVGVGYIGTPAFPREVRDFGRLFRSLALLIPPDNPMRTGPNVFRYVSVKSGDVVF